MDGRVYFGMYSILPHLSDCTCIHSEGIHTEYIHSSFTLASASPQSADFAWGLILSCWICVLYWRHDIFLSVIVDIRFSAVPYYCKCICKWDNLKSRITESLPPCHQSITVKSWLPWKWRGGWAVPHWRQRHRVMKKSNLPVSLITGGFESETRGTVLSRYCTVHMYRALWLASRQWNVFSLSGPENVQ